MVPHMEFRQLRIDLYTCQYELALPCSAQKIAHFIVWARVVSRSAETKKPMPCGLSEQCLVGSLVAIT